MPKRITSRLTAQTHESSPTPVGIKQHNPPPSYAETAYFGIHTFRFIDGEDRITKVKFRFVPRDGEHSLSDSKMQRAPRDFLEAAYAERLTKGPTQ